MKKRNLSLKEEDQLQKLKKENKKLKKTISSLRKVIDRLDLDRHKQIKELISSQSNDNYESKKENLEKKWRCYECVEGILRLIIINRLDGIKYLRKCDNCGKRTKTKNYDENVEGI